MSVQHAVSFLRVQSAAACAKRGFTSLFHDIFVSGNWLPFPIINFQISFCGEECRHSTHLIYIRSFFMIRMFYCLPAKVTSLFYSDFLFRSRSGLLCFGKIQNKKNSIFGSISVLNLDYFQITNKSQLIAYSFIQISL